MLHDGRNPVHPRRRRLEGRRRPQHHRFLTPAAHDLESHREPACREAAGHGDGGESRHRDAIGEKEPLRVVVERLAVDLRRIGDLDRERRHGDGGQDEQLASLHEGPHALPERRPQGFRPSDLLGRELETLLDVPHQPFLHLLLPLGELVGIVGDHG